MSRHDWADFPDVPAIMEASRERARRTGRADWFGPNQMRFFGTRCESPVIAGCLFITSETPGDGEPRLYAVRRALADGEIDTVWHAGGSGVRVFADLESAVVYAVFHAIGAGWTAPLSEMLDPDDDTHPNRAAVALILALYQGAMDHAKPAVYG